mmetsp:Transcript_47293/g.102684  ORF Transcript_47293/g.102684 Transcript_47293/m.102684 type:complete len:221 (-) Transcript_47293:4-666(-)
MERHSRAGTSSLRRRGSLRDHSAGARPSGGCVCVIAPCQGTGCRTARHIYRASRGAASSRGQVPRRRRRRSPRSGRQMCRPELRDGYRITREPLPPGRRHCVSVRGRQHHHRPCPRRRLPGTRVISLFPRHTRSAHQRAGVVAVAVGQAQHRRSVHHLTSQTSQEPRQRSQQSQGRVQETGGIIQGKTVIEVYGSQRTQTKLSHHEAFLFHVASRMNHSM